MHRGKLEVTISVLAALENRPQNMTAIMLKARLSFTRAKKLLQKLIAAHLVEIAEQKQYSSRAEKTYALTPKGRKALEAAKTLIELLTDTKDEKYAELLDEAVKEIRFNLKLRTVYAE